VLSLGRNRIRELRHIEYLRKFKKLRCLCLSGNPMCDSISYRQHVYAYLGQAGQLKYLDYMLVDHSEALAAVETYHVDELAELREREVGSNQKADRDKRKKEQMEILKESFLDSTAELLDELFTGEEETEGFCVRILHGYPVLKEDFKDKVAELIKTLRKEVLEKNSVRTKMMFHFRRAATEGIAESEGEANNLLGSYLKDLKKIFEECDEVDNMDQLERCENRLLELGTTDLEILGKKLMMLEISLQESLQEAIDYFEIAVQDVVRAMSDKGSDFYRALEELEKTFYQDLLEAASSELESFAAGTHPVLASEGSLGDDGSYREGNSPRDSVAGRRITVEIPGMQFVAESAKIEALSNKEDMMTACANLNEHHVTVIQNRDDQMQAQISGWSHSYFHDLREKYYRRNRQRITDIR
ncbi:leucine rich repeat, partial [Perkinsus olseni]